MFWRGPSPAQREHEVSEQDSSWKASVDGVVSEFDEVTRHLRVRQRQALRVVWSAVGATALATGVMIALNLSSFSAVPLRQQTSLALLDPATQVPVLIPGSVTPFLPVQTPVPSPEAAPPPAGSTAPATVQASAPRRPRALTPAAPPALVASIGPATAQPPADPPTPPGLVDGLVAGVVHLLG